jgi:hypothetical protein
VLTFLHPIYRIQTPAPHPPASFHAQSPAIRKHRHANGRAHAATCEGEFGSINLLCFTSPSSESLVASAARSITVSPYHHNARPHLHCILPTHHRRFHTRRAPIQKLKPPPLTAHTCLICAQAKCAARCSSTHQTQAKSPSNCAVSPTSSLTPSPPASPPQSQPQGQALLQCHTSAHSPARHLRKNTPKARPVLLSRAILTERKAFTIAPRPDPALSASPRSAPTPQVRPNYPVAETTILVVAAMLSSNTLRDWSSSNRYGLSMPGFWR